ncbi:Protein of unknown function [Gryllus bimaculatus]|nr:Protein of unknown function [Gryllus bimaculatus]
MESAASAAAFASRAHAPEDDRNMSTFARRDGTSSQHGVSFQYQVAALLLARALARDPGARVGAEHKHAGVFDDVSVHVRPAPGRAPVLLLLQLKHKSDKSNAPRVGSQALRGDSGSFAVRKYYRDTYYVLFTNAALPEGALLEAPVGPGALPRAAARLLHTGCGRGQPRVLAPHADHLAGEARGPEFQARFLWLGSQASDVELLELLAQELTQHMRRVPGDLAARARALVHAVEEWYEATGDVRYLTADWEPWRRLVVHADADAPLLRELRFHDAEIRR